MPSLSPEQLHADNGYKLIVLSSVFSVLCIIVVVARFWAPRKREAELWWDDWLCIPSLVRLLLAYLTSDAPSRVGADCFLVLCSRLECD